MRAIKIIAIILILLVLGVFGLILWVAEQDTHGEKSDPSQHQLIRIYQELITYRNFNKWSPWAIKDPNAAYSYTGPQFGVGLNYLLV